MTQQEKNPANLLLKILHGDIDHIKIDNKKSIILAHKLTNKVLRAFVEEFRKNHQVDDKTLLNLMLVFDEAIENQFITQATLDYIKVHPEILDKYIRK
ncbi:MAG: hypothetical protein WCJ58_08075 [bacterium]